eukprot:6949932-Pyramimonas_sp.AAC.1
MRWGVGCGALTLRCFFFPCPFARGLGLPEGTTDAADALGPSVLEDGALQLVADDHPHRDSPLHGGEEDSNDVY